MTYYAGPNQPALLTAGLAAIRALSAQLAAMELDASAQYEIDFRLRLKERGHQHAVFAAHGLSFDAVADDGLVVAGQAVKLSILAVNRGASDVVVSGISNGFDAHSGCVPGVLKKDAVYTCAPAHISPKRCRQHHISMTTTGIIRRTRQFRS